ncbi:hypothetical protein EVAR_23400_1 [Eumeta japonica]|uniref:Uncharacterized protein n=1 Tax=Eumeta variegata TaxID=151549 RepID=A0A4C1VWN0_EUMVA|nr:hypothetical protein EVAR_23400_1 [Eumeta japonica]
METNRQTDIREHTFKKRRVRSRIAGELGNQFLTRVISKALAPGRRRSSSDLQQPSTELSQPRKDFDIQAFQFVEDRGRIYLSSEVIKKCNTKCKRPIAFSKIWHLCDGTISRRSNGLRPFKLLPRIDIEATRARLRIPSFDAPGRRWRHRVDGEVPIFRNSSKFGFRIPIGYAVRKKKSKKTLLLRIKYEEHQCQICQDVKVVALLLRPQLGYTRFCSFTCEWDKCDRREHYNKEVVASSSGTST